MFARAPLRVIPQWIFERWILVAYLIINWNIKELAEGIKIKPDKEFYAVVAKYLSAYTQEGVMPPAEIAPAILNLADDMLADRPMNMRAGDYISIQTFIRGMK